MKLITIDNWKEHYEYFHKENPNNYSNYELWLRGDYQGEYLCSNCCLSVYVDEGEELPRVCPYCGVFPMKED